MPRRTRQGTFAITILIGTASALLACNTTPAGAATHTRASVTPMHIVGDPVAADGAAVVITVDAHHDLHLVGVAPNTGQVIWSRPYEESLIIPGLAPAVYIVANNVIDIAPTGNPDNPSALIEGINATTGAVVWKAQSGLIVADQPLPCADKTNFCVIGYNQNGTTAMAVINPSTGHLNEALAGPARALDDDLYQTDASTPTLEEFSPYGTIIWTKKVSDLLGSADFNPDYGWDFLPYGSNEVGSISSSVQGRNYGLDNARTVGIDTLNGSVVFSNQGEFECGGSIEDQSPAFLCRYSGNTPVPRTTKKAKKQTSATLTRSYAGMSMQMQGFSPQSGSITWTQSVKDIAALSNGHVAALDNSHIIIETSSGHRVLLDTDSGHTAPVAKGEAFWCTAVALFKVNEDTKANPTDQRVSASAYTPCTDTGHSTSTLPSTNPSNIGVTVDGVFLWPTPQGLARRVIAQASGFA